MLKQLRQKRFIVLVVAVFAAAVFLLTRPGKALAPIAVTVGLSQANISAVVLPHHDLVKQQRQDFLGTLKQTIAQPKTIILVSPNHYESGSAMIQTTSQLWDTSVGPIEPNKTVIQALINAGAGDEPGSFSNEHGIRLILGDLERTWPNASIVPIILKFDVSAKQVTDLNDTLARICDGCLLVASVDFSHYQPAILADLHDSLSKRLLENRDVEGLLNKAEVDSPAALALMVTWAQRHDTQRFVTINQTNSGVLAGSPDIETTTHLFGWYEHGEPTAPAKSINFLVGGDMMFGRAIANTFLPKLEQSLDQLGNRLFWGTDAGIINLEGPVSDVSVPQPNVPNNLIFNFPPETIRSLTYLGVNGASLGNNHSHNAGSKGLQTTVRLLEEVNIQPIGGPDSDRLVEIGTFKGEGLTLYVISVHLLAEQPDLTTQIQSLKGDPNARVLVFPHWGAEYAARHGSGQERLAHAWIDAGADLVIGTHPHVVQDAEVYKGVPIIYSLGNLLFDQTFSVETQQGMLIGGEFTADKLKLFALPTESRNLKPRLTVGAGKAKRIEALMRPFAGQRTESEGGSVYDFPAASATLKAE